MNLIGVLIWFICQIIITIGLMIVLFVLVDKLDKHDCWWRDRNSFIYALEQLNYDGQFIGSWSESKDFDHCVWYNALVFRRKKE